MKRHWTHDIRTKKPSENQQSYKKLKYGGQNCLMTWSETYLSHMWDFYVDSIWIGKGPLIKVNFKYSALYNVLFSAI